MQVSFPETYFLRVAVWEGWAEPVDQKRQDEYMDAVFRAPDQIVSR